MTMKFQYIHILLLTITFSACQRKSAVTVSPENNQAVVKPAPPEKKPAVVQKDTIPPPKVVLKDTVSIIGVGDIMLGTNYPTNYLSPEDGKELLKPVIPILQNADATFGNLEGTLFNGEGTPKKCSDPTKCYAFRSPEHYINHLKDAGFDLLALANNHSGDFGIEGRRATAKVIKEAGLKAAGTPDWDYTIYENKGIKFGMAAFSPFVGTCDIMDYEYASSVVKRLDSLCDIVIVSFHGGAEGKAARHVTRKNEIFYGEDRGNMYEFCHKMVDAGADIIFGHGPHVTRGVEIYKDRLIAYSLGNFATYARFNLSGENGIAPLLKVFTNAEGKFLYSEVISIKQVGEGGPQVDSTNAAFFSAKELTEADFPETPVKFSEGRYIFKK